MSKDWQTWTALAIVVVTAVLYVRRLVRRKKSKGSSGGGACESDCGCDKQKPPTQSKSSDDE